MARKTGQIVRLGTSTWLVRIYVGARLGGIYAGGLFARPANDRKKPKAWVGLGWRQFLYWFADAEARLTAGEAQAELILQGADDGWGKIDTAKVLMDERHNNGGWIRRWLNILNDFAGQRSSLSQ